MVSELQIQKISNIIQNQFSPEKIILFGSYANGNSSEESDLDFCVVKKLGTMRKLDLIRKIRSALDTTIPIDILVYDKNEFDERSIIPSTFEFKILNSGKVFDGKSGISK